MRVIIVTPWFPNLRDGWPAPFVAESSIALAKRGAELSVIVLRGWVPPGFESFSSLEHHGEICRTDFPEITRLRTRRYLTLPGELFRVTKNYLLDQAVETALEEEIRIFGPALIYVHTESLAPAAARAAGRNLLPLVVALHGENTNARYIKDPRQAERFRDALSSADRLVIVGDPLRPFASGLAGRQDHIVVIWNGVNPPRLPRVKRELGSGPLNLICVANLVAEKGIDLLIAALTKLELTRTEKIAEWNLIIIGDGPMRKLLQSQVNTAQLSSKIKFVGTMANSEVFSWLSQSDIFVLPSFREAFGVAYVEAMASGLLTIGTEGQGPSQFIEHGRTGFLVKPRDVDSLESILRCILSDTAESWRGIASAGAEYSKRACTWDAHAEKLLALFHEVVDR